MTCSAVLNIADASTTVASNTTGDVAIIVCHDSYRIYNTRTNSIHATCMLDESGRVAEWCWVTPCEGRYWFCSVVEITTPFLKC